VNVGALGDAQAISPPNYRIARMASINWNSSASALV
jgi:hypothetical protein